MHHYSILDLAPVAEGQTEADALRNMVDLARVAEAAGYHRYWLAEHHNMPGIASSATAVVIGQVAAATTRIRVGAGGIMLPNHAPLVVAEQFGTLAHLFPGRIDLGLGRAPGTDMATARALRRYMTGEEDFPHAVQELIGYLGDAPEGARVRAVPGQGTHVPVWILGSSLYGAQLAAYLGLPYAFASHFAPAALEQALHVYRSDFRPSAFLARPYAMVAAGVCAAPTDDEAVLAQCLVCLDAKQHFADTLQLCLIEGFLNVFHFAEHVLFRPGWQIHRHLALGTAQQEGAKPGRQPDLSMGILAPVESLPEVFSIPEHTWHGERHQAPDV